MSRSILQASRVLPSKLLKRTLVSSVDAAEVAKFNSHAQRWWDPRGVASPLHKMNPTRVAFVRAAIEKRRKFLELTKGLTGNSTGDKSAKPLKDVDLIDVGCGGGLVTEPMARLGANVLGIDMSEEAIAVANTHMRQDVGLREEANLSYQKIAVEDLVESKRQFEAVLALEIVEHVANPSQFIKDCSSLVREGGIFVLSTLNRTVQSYALAILGAEYVLQWLPKGTHSWSRFPRPEEIVQVIESDTDLKRSDLVGVGYDPFSDSFHLREDTSVNYIITTVKPLRSGAV